MKRLNFFYIAAFGFFSLYASAQMNQTPVTGGGRQLLVSAEKPMAATGSMYIDEKFMPAKIGVDNVPTLLRYNAYSDYFEMNNPQEQSTKALPKQVGTVVTFVGTGEEYTYAEYKNEEGKDQNGYLNIIKQGPKVSIYKKESIYLQPGSVASNSYQTSKAAAYKRNDDQYYIKLKDQAPAFFSSKKELAKLLPEKSKEVLDYIKQNKIDIEKEADLQKLSVYLETIL